VRAMLFDCGDSSIGDSLPAVCIEQGLSINECGMAGHMQGSEDTLGIPNLTGRREQAYATFVCSKCTGYGSIRSETFAKLCDPAVTLAACQRFEDATAQRLCNYCTPDNQGSVLPQRGAKKGCSFYRGTCAGSVENRIRGVVPPNEDIVANHIFGGLRYCKKPAPFTSQKHYYTEENIMTPGQSCLDHTPMFTNWDFSRDKERSVKKAPFFLECNNYNNPKTCPYSRNCVSAELCPEDNADWTDFDQVLLHWGEEILTAFADPVDESLIDAYTGELPPPSFEAHKVVLDPHTAYLHANWGHVDLAWLLRYTVVDWSVDGPESEDDDGYVPNV